uniref:Uncharacterized protein n=1 Tax=Anguilla anguilla TaxID=7936 RepID=A0A0E9Q7H5_ANGAN
MSPGARMVHRMANFSKLSNGEAPVNIVSLCIGYLLVDTACGYFNPRLL